MSADHTDVATSQHRVLEAPDRETFDRDAYQDPAYLDAALAAGLDVETLAQAHEVSTRSLYRILDDSDVAQPPSNGPARTLWEASPDSIPGDD